MYDETIQRSARRQRIAPIEFEHPVQDVLLACFDQRTADPVSVILTGTAGDGKTHLCRNRIVPVIEMARVTGRNVEIDQVRPRCSVGVLDRLAQRAGRGTQVVTVVALERMKAE